MTASNTTGPYFRQDVLKITNNSSSPVDTHLIIVARGLPNQIAMANASGTTSAGDPYLRVFLPDGVLLPGQSTAQTLQFKTRRPVAAPPISYSLGSSRVRAIHESNGE